MRLYRSRIPDGTTAHSSALSGAFVAPVMVVVTATWFACSFVDTASSSPSMLPHRAVVPPAVVVFFFLPWTIEGCDTGDRKVRVDGAVPADPGRRVRSGRDPSRLERRPRGGPIKVRAAPWLTLDVYLPRYVFLGGAIIA